MSGERIADLLTRTTQQKLMIANPSAVLKLAREAYELSLAASVTKRWRQLAAYRLAQLLLRGAGDDVDTLFEILQLLEEAAGTDDLDAIGPLPLIYQLPVLNRLVMLAARPHEELCERREKAFATAAKRLSLRPKESSRSGGEPFLLAQSGTFNLLEISSYFMGFDYGRLLGLGSEGRNEDLGFAGIWRILSNRSAPSSIRFNEIFAASEIEFVLGQDSSAIGFRLDSNGVDGQWKTNSTEWQPWTGDNHVRMLTMNLRRPRPSVQECADRLGTSLVTLRKLRNRMHERLVAKLAEAGQTVDPESLRFESLISEDSELPVYVMAQSKHQ